MLDDDGAEPQHCVERDDVLGLLGRTRATRSPALTREPAEPLRRAGDLVAEFPVGCLASEELERDGVTPR